MRLHSKAQRDEYVRSLKQPPAVVPPRASCGCRCYGCQHGCDFHWSPRLRVAQWIRDRW